MIEVIERWWVTPGEEDSFDPFENVVGKCQVCSSPYVLGLEAEPSGEPGPLQQRYPEPVRGLPSYVPQSVRESHDEAVRCMRVACYTAAAIMSRRGVEAICAENSATGRNLASKLTNLKDTGVIDERLFNWSSVVRDLGNSGAHDVTARLTREDADDAIAFFEALVNYLYTFGQRYNDHMARQLI